MIFSLVVELHTETHEELNKAYEWLLIVLSFVGLYMYKKLMTTEAGKSYDGCVVDSFTIYAFNTNDIIILVSAAYLRYILTKRRV